MSKIVLNDITSSQNVSNINNNFSEIENQLNNKVLYRDNPFGEPNHMENTLDMNSNRIINLPEPLNENEAARLKDVQNAISASSANLISFTPYSTIGSTNVQAAIQEVVDEVASTFNNLNTATEALALANYDINVSSIANLRTVDRTKYKNAFVSGYYLSGDGGGGSYYYDSSDVVSADNGGTVIVAVDGGRWKLQNTGTVSLLQFGAKGDGVTDASSALTAALASAKTIYIPPTASGIRFDSTITVPSNARIYGDWKKTKIVGGMDASRLFDINGSNVCIEGLVIDFTGTAAGSVAFRFRTDLSSMEQIFIRDIETLGASGFAHDIFHASNIGVAWRFYRCVSKVHRGPGIDFRQAFAYITFEDITIDYVGSASRNHQAFQLRNNSGSVFTRVDVTGGLVDATTTSNDAFFFDNCVAVWLTDCMADTVGGNGFYLFGRCRGFYFVNCVSSLVGKVGYAVGGVGGASFDIVFSNCSFFGRRGQSFAPVFSGYQFDGSNKVQLTGCKVQDATGSGIFFNAAARNTVSGCRFDTNAAWGIISAGTSSVLVTGSCFDTNTSGNASFSSAGQLLQVCQGGAGTLISLTGPGTV